MLVLYLPLMSLMFLTLIRPSLFLNLALSLKLFTLSLHDALPIYRHLAVEGEIVGEVHGSHPPTPQLGEDLVLAERCFAQGIELGVVLGGQWTAHRRRDRGARAARSQRDAGEIGRAHV